jgi:hypothetical protein
MYTYSLLPCAVLGVLSQLVNLANSDQVPPSERASERASERPSGAGPGRL